MNLSLAIVSILPSISPGLWIWTWHQNCESFSKSKGHTSPATGWAKPGTMAGFQKRGRQVWPILFGSCFQCPKDRTEDQAHLSRPTTYAGHLIIYNLYQLIILGAQQTGYPPLIKHGTLGNPLMEGFSGKIIYKNGECYIAMFHYQSNMYRVTWQSNIPDFYRWFTH